MAANSKHVDMEQHLGDSGGTHPRNSPRFLGLESGGSGQAVGPGLDRGRGSSSSSPPLAPSSVKKSRVNKELPSISEYVQSELARPPSPFLSNRQNVNLGDSSLQNESNGRVPRRNTTETVTNAGNAENRGPQPSAAQFPFGAWPPNFHPSFMWPPQTAPVPMDQLSQMMTKITEMMISKKDENLKPKPADDEIESSSVEEDSEEEVDSSMMKWTGGEKILPRKNSCSLSQMGQEVFLGLTGRDNPKEKYKLTKAPDISKKMSFYTSNSENVGFVQQDLDKVFPQLRSWKKNNDDKMKRKGNIFGAIAAANVAGVDSLRRCVNGLLECANDFESDQEIENPRIEAALACKQAANLLEHEIIVDLMAILKFAAAGFVEITNERRALALTQFKGQEIQRLLAEVPPNETFLFGGQVQQAAQQLRDATLLARSFADPTEKFPPNKTWGGPGKNKRGNDRDRGMVKKPDFETKKPRFALRKSFTNKRMNPYKKDKFKKKDPEKDEK